MEGLQIVIYLLLCKFAVLEKKGKMKISAMRNREGDIEFKTEAIGKAVRKSFKERLQGEDECGWIRDSRGA